MSGKMLRQIPVDASMQSVAINGYELGGQTLYDSRVFSAPPYTSAVLSPEPDITPADAACIPQPGQSCDLQGRRLADLPRKGVYVRGGRKYVVK